jgi:hypothetical protein
MDLYAGLMALAMGDPQRAVAHLERAQRRAEAMGAEPFAARAAEILAEAVRQRDVAA